MSECQVVASSTVVINDELITKYVDEAFIHEQRSLNIFERVSQCSNKIDSANKLVGLLLESDYYCIRTKNVKYPKTLIEYAKGTASPNVIAKLIENRPTTFTKTYYDEMQKQLLYNSIRGNKNAISCIEYVMMEDFNINYTDRNGMTALKLALLCNAKPKFISYLLSFNSILLTGEVYDYALNSKFAHTNIDSYITILQLLVNKYIPIGFLDKYFNKKREINNENSTTTSNLWCKLEESLLIDGIEDFFEECEHPMLMAKMWCTKLKNKLISQEVQQNKNSRVITIGCDGSQLKVMCCVHNDKDQCASVTVFCNKSCPGHNIV